MYTLQQPNTVKYNTLPTYNFILPIKHRKTYMHVTHLQLQKNLSITTYELRPSTTTKQSKLDTKSRDKAQSMLLRGHLAEFE